MKARIAVEHLLKNNLVIVQRMHPGVILLSDYDGTLVQISKSPELAVLPREMKELLRALSKSIKIVVVSGRQLSELKALVGLRKVYYVGNHGFEISGPKMRLVRPEAIRTATMIAQICQRLRERLGSTKGVIIEDKGATASVHYRMVKKSGAAALRRVFAETVDPYLKTGEIRITTGKKVLEIRPNVDWDKGKAITWIIAQVDPKRELIPIYMGDDRTDEDAFIALEKSGITVLISKNKRKSHAKFFLKNVHEVKVFLDRLLEMNENKNVGTSSKFFCTI